jgi:nitrate reductase delta subunit
VSPLRRSAIKQSLAIKETLAIKEVSAVRQVCSWCLSYPDEQLMGRRELLRAVLAELPADDRSRQLAAFLDHLDATPLERLQNDYVEVFDLARTQTLYLSYWTDGDTRRRGDTLARFKRHYRDSGFLVDTHGELPDHLPLVLEYAAVADADGGTALLQEFRASLELIRLSLADRRSPYAALLEAVCSTLPGASPSDRAGAMQLAGPPPAEAVGLEPYGRPLIPVNTR